eukprot:GILJ01024436.1.p1 GENE.GILJ01024436.1~~GILJ01024436.1.p1  ORF type:complete len:529 (-),score=50.76 GILJ01024436.1:36-1622(-)
MKKRTRNVDNQLSLLSFMEKKPKYSPPTTRLTSEYSIERSSVLGASQELQKDLDRHKPTLTLTAGGRKAEKRSKRSKDPTQIPKQFELWSEDEQRFHVPRFYGVQHWGPPTETTPPTDLAVSANMTMKTRFRNDTQQEAFDKMMDAYKAPGGGGGGQLCLPCGVGKTMIALAIACALQKKTIVLIPSINGMTQWADEIAFHTNVTVVGWIQSKVTKKERERIRQADIVLASLATVATSKTIDDLAPWFGHMIVDECHQIMAPVLSQSLRRFPTTYVTGLSASPERPDGLHYAIAWYLGPVVHRVIRPPEPVDLHVTVYHYPPAMWDEIKEKKLYGNVRSLASMIRWNTDRNTYCRQRLLQLVKSDPRAKIYAVTDCLKHLAYMRHEMQVLCDSTLGKKDQDQDQRQWTSAYTGSLKPEERKAASTAHVIFITQQLVAENLNVVDANMMFFLTPFIVPTDDETGAPLSMTLEQCVGRIQRIPVNDRYRTIYIEDIADQIAIFNKAAKNREQAFTMLHITPKSRVHHSSS